MKIAKWMSAAVLALLVTWFTDFLNLGFRQVVPSPIVVCRWMRVCPPAPKEIACSAEARQRQPAPAGFDFGLPQYSQQWVRIDDDEFCDYCRIVGNEGARQLWCTLGTKEGLTGTTLKSGVIDAGYPETGSWINFQGKGVPAFSRVVGSSHEKLFITPVYPTEIGTQVELPNGR